MLNKLAAALPELLWRLRRADYTASTDQYLSALDLLSHLYVNQQPPTASQLRAAFAGLFCTSPDEQQRFQSLFDGWYESLDPTFKKTPTEPVKPLPSEPISWPKRFRRSYSARALPWLISTIFTAILAVALYTSITTELSGIKELADTSTPAETEAKAQPSTTASTFLPPPRQPLATPLAPPAFYPWWGTALQYLWLLPVFLWLAWTSWLIFYRVLVLRREKMGNQEALTLEHLTISPADQRLFDDPSLEDYWRSLRRFRNRQSRRLDIKATVRDMLKNGGYFEPRYRQRALAPAYLVLIDRYHKQDHSAGLAYDFVAAMRREQLQVVDLYYRHDPRFSHAQRAQPGASREPAEFVSLYSDHDLVLYGEGAALSDQRRSALSPWTQVFSWWPRKCLLSPAPLWSRRVLIQQLLKSGFRTAALSTAALGQLADEKVMQSDDDPHDLPVPAILARDPLAWLQEHGLSRRQTKRAIDEVRSYLGADGFLLFAATASYPELRWELTRALDLQLELDAKTREWRLRKLARLVWFRHAYIPDSMRYAIFKRLSKTDLQRLSDAFQALFEQANTKALQLPVAIPQWKQQKPELKDAIASAQLGEPFSDRVLASVIRGRRPTPLEFALPFDMLRRQVAQDWRALAIPLFIGALLLPAALWSNAWFWRTTAQASVNQHALQRLQTASASTAVRIDYRPQTQSYAQSLQAELRQRGFKVTLQQQAAPISQTDATTTGESKNRLEYASTEAAVLDNLLSGYRFISYGAELIEEIRPQLAQDELRLNFLEVPTVFQDAFGSGMVTIPKGCFKMGSPKGTGSDDERPLHEVCFGADFQIGKYEVTFEEYDAYLAMTDNKNKPGDEGWGRGKRPVINISWDSARQYAVWLGGQIDLSCRLPSEAEWEYAARGGTDTNYWWGDKIGKNKANCDGCDSEWDNKQTAPAGSFEANQFGLYDTVGNVWEWVEDYWHADYKQAPEDGSAWLAENGGDETRRVVRGGSWFSHPDSARAADRGGVNPDDRDGNLGFRVLCVPHS